MNDSAIDRNDHKIKKISMEPDPRTGNRLFKISKSQYDTTQFRSDFLTPHRKDYYFFAYILSGSSKHWIDMTPYILKNNTMYFTVPTQVHLKEESKPLSGYILSFTKEFLALEENSSFEELPIIQNPYNGHELSLTAKDSEYIEDLLQKIQNEYLHHDDYQLNMLQSYTKTFLIYLSRLYKEQITSKQKASTHQLMRSFTSKVELYYKANHEVSTYAEMLNITASHLGETVKDQTGKSAIQHIQERITLEAKRLLLHTDLAIKEVAFELGFDDPAYFNRFFKRNTETTPMSYRAAIRKMYQ